MTTNLRFVFDTNVIVSATLLKKSVARQAFDAARAQGCLLISQETLNELNDVLRRPKFNQYISEHERLQMLAALAREAVLVEVTAVITQCRDPKDNKFLELALSGEADYIVSGDKDLLTLHPFENIAIIRPSQVIELL